LFVPGAQTQVEVGDAKPISHLANGFGFFKSGFSPHTYLDSSSLELILFKVNIDHNSTHRIMGAGCYYDVPSFIDGTKWRWLILKNEAMFHWLETRDH